MFFKQIKTYSKKKLRVLNITFSLLYFIALVVIPIIIVCENYAIFEQAEATTKLTGIGVIMVVVLGFFAFVKLKDAVDSLPQLVYKQQCIKFTLQMLFGLIPYGLIIGLLIFARNEFEIAYNTSLWSMISLVAAHLLDGLVIKYLKAELALRNKALELVEVELRKGLVK